jgi:hypothetical protein
MSKIKKWAIGVWRAILGKPPIINKIYLPMKDFDYVEFFKKLSNKGD